MAAPCLPLTLSIDAGDSTTRVIQLPAGNVVPRSRPMTAQTTFDPRHGLPQTQNSTAPLLAAAGGVWSPTLGASVADETETVERPNRRPTLIRAEVSCYLCGLCGNIEMPLTRPLPSTAVFHPSDGRAVYAVDWRRITCPRCTGTTYLELVETVRQRPDDLNLDWRIYQPRRGRAPRWLRELRQEEESE
jgi:hypothetical protein